MKKLHFIATCILLLFLIACKKKSTNTSPKFSDCDHPISKMDSVEKWMKGKWEWQYDIELNRIQGGQYTYHYPQNMGITQQFTFTQNKHYYLYKNQSLVDSGYYDFAFLGNDSGSLLLQMYNKTSQALPSPMVTMCQNNLYFSWGYLDGLYKQSWVRKGY